MNSFIIVKMVGDQKLYLKSTKRDKMVTADRGFKKFSKKSTAEQWIKDLNLEGAVVEELGEPRSQKTPRKLKVGTDHIGSFDEDMLFATLNEKCLGCKKVCKQSGKATVVYCPEYKSNKTDKKAQVA